MKSSLKLRLLIFAGLLFLIPIACSLLTTEIPDLPASTKAPGEPSVIPETPRFPQASPPFLPSLKIFS